MAVLRAFILAGRKSVLGEGVLYSVSKIKEFFTEELPEHGF